MKNLLLGILLISNTITAQEIWPNYPNKSQVGMSYNSMASQLAYYDLNYALPHVQIFSQKKLSWITGTTTQKDNVYTCRLEDDRSPEFIDVAFTTFKIENIPVVESIKFTGSTNLLIEFFTHYWPTAAKTTLGTGYEIRTQYINDRALFRSENGAATITVTSSTKYNNDQYAAEYLKKKAEKPTAAVAPKSEALLAQEKRNREIDERRERIAQEKKAKESRTIDSRIVQVKFKADNYKIKEELTTEELNAVKTALKKEKYGVYDMNIQKITENETIRYSAMVLREY